MSRRFWGSLGLFIVVLGIVAALILDTFLNDNILPLLALWGFGIVGAAIWAFKSDGWGLLE